MTLLENEIKLDSLTESVVLTNYRIVKENRNSLFSIFLENISSIAMHRKDNPFLLKVGIGSFTVGVILYNNSYEDMSYWIFGVGAIFIIIYYLTIKHVIIISPDGGEKLYIEVKSSSTERIKNFLTNIQKAKQWKWQRFRNIFDV